MRRMYQGNLPACNVIPMKPEDFKPLPRRHEREHLQLTNRLDWRKVTLLLVGDVLVFVLGAVVGWIVRGG